MIIFLGTCEADHKVFSNHFHCVGHATCAMDKVGFNELLWQEERKFSRTIDAVVVEEFPEAANLIKKAYTVLGAPIIVLVREKNLDQTKMLLQNGADDVVEKPVQPEELHLRIAAIKRRMVSQPDMSAPHQLIVHFDGREPEFDGKILPLRRKERRILEFLVSMNGRRVTKSQVFEAVYGRDEDRFDERLIESHMSRLRSTLKRYIGSDPICSLRHLGYRIDVKRLSSPAVNKWKLAA